MKELEKLFQEYKKNLDSYMNCLNLLSILTLPYWIFKLDLEILLIIFMILIYHHSEIPEIKNTQILGISLILFDLLTFILTEKEINCNFVYFLIIGYLKLEKLRFCFYKNYFRYYHIILKILIYFTKYFLNYELNQKFDKFIFHSLIFTLTIQVIMKLLKIHEAERFKFHNNSKEFNEFKVMCANFPVGVMICKVAKEIQTGKAKFRKISYLNTSAGEILKLSTSSSEKEFLSQLSNFEIVKDSKSNKNVLSLNLFEFIMNSPQNLNETQHGLVKCLSTNKLIAVKINEFESHSLDIEEEQTDSSNNIDISYKIISVENLSEEKKEIQNKIYKNLKSKFLLTISHELNNPLNGLIYYCDKIITEEDIFKRSNIVQKIKKLKFSIKFFIKNLNLTSKIILREKINMEITMVNFSHILNKVLNRFVPFLENKRIKYISNLKNYNNIVIKTDYNYFKFFLKNVFMYVCHKIEAKKTLKMETQIVFEKRMIKLNFHKQNTNKYIYQYTDNFRETPLSHHIKIGESVQTEGMLREILFTLSENLKLKITVNDSLSGYLLSCEIPFENLESMNETEDMVEFTPEATDQKDDNMKVLSRNINFTENHMLSKKNKYELKSRKSMKIFEKQENFRNNLINRLDENLDEKGLLKFNKLKTITEASNFNDNFQFNNGNNNHNGDNLINSKNNDHTNDNIDYYKNLTEVEKNNTPKSIQLLNEFKTEDKKYMRNSSDINHVDETNLKEKSAYYKMMKNSTNNEPNEKELLNKFEEHLIKPNNISNSGLVSKVQQENIPKYINDKYGRTQHKVPKISEKQDRLEKTCCNFRDILVVDDEIFNISTIKFMLKNFKLIPDTCENGLLAVEKVSDSLNKNCCDVDYKLILMDVMMPIMDGIEASQKIQEIYLKHNKNLPCIIIISAHDSEEIYAKIKDIGVIKEFVEKPVRKSKIEEILKKFYF